MKVLLINPEPKNYTRARCAPLGLLSIASYLNANGHTAKILNRPIKKTDITTELDSFKPDFVGCSFTSLMPIEDGILVSKEAKRRNICVVWGGQYITCNYTLFHELDCFDFISMGEGEETWLDLCNAAENNIDLKTIAGLAYKDENNNMITTAERPFMDLTKLPPIDYSLVDTAKTLYINYDYDKTVAMYLSKGCNATCTFCYNKAFHKRCYRERNIEHLIEEAHYLKKNCGVNAISFADEFFGYNKDNLRRICNTFIEKDLGLYWGCMTKIGIFDKEDFELMYKAGCRWIEFGVESGAPTTLRRMKKALLPERVEIDLKNCTEAGLITLCYFIVGFPDETEEELKETCRLLNKIKYTKFICSHFNPLAGSEAYDNLVEEGRLKPHSSYKQELDSVSFQSLSCNYSEIKSLDLKVVRNYILWCSLFRKSFKEDTTTTYAILKRDVTDVLKSLKGHGFKEGTHQFFASAKEFLEAFYYANFFPSIIKKYGLNLKPDKE